MPIPDLLTAVLWGLVWQLPWIAGLIVALLLYRWWKTSGFIVLALGLLIVWGVAGPLVMVAVRRWALGGPGLCLITFSAISFVDSLISIALVLFLATALCWLMKDLAGSEER